MKTATILSAFLLLAAPAWSADAATDKPATANDGFPTKDQDNDNDDFFSAEDFTANYVRAFGSYSLRLKGNNCDAGHGGEIGFLAAHSDWEPSIAIVAGFYRFNGMNDLDGDITSVPITARLTLNLPVSKKRLMFTIAGGGGYSLNSVNRDQSGVVYDIADAYVLEGQVGFKYKVNKFLALTVTGGYQFQNPRITYRVAGVNEYSYKDMSSAFAKFGVEF